jgi:GTP-binding protein
VVDINFIDYVKICCRSGSGGPGSVHFLRTKETSKGGPDGGDGGLGGSVILRGNKNLWTLLHLKYKKHVIADNGLAGLGNLKTGADGKSVVLEVPLGTVARDLETGNIEFEILEDGETQVFVPGGKGGLGNCHFKSSTRQAPRYAQPGIPGIESWKVLELKILADVGLVGKPNAGKSTFLSVVTAAKPKIADYPFTTLKPNLGIVPYRDYQSFIIADIPGIIDGAHKGRGLGHRFMKHIERNALLLFMISADSKDINNEYNMLVSELKEFNKEILLKRRMVAITKSDLLDDELKAGIEAELDLDVPYMFISSLSSIGLIELKDLLWKELNVEYE